MPQVVLWDKGDSAATAGQSVGPWEAYITMEVREDMWSAYMNIPGQVGKSGMKEEKQGEGMDSAADTPSRKAI